MRYCLYCLNSILAMFTANFFNWTATENQTELDSFFFRVRGYDEAGNRGAWSNEVPVSSVNPADYYHVSTRPGLQLCIRLH